MVKPTLVKFQSLWPICGRQRKMAETLDQKTGRYGISAPDPTLLADPHYEGIGTNGRPGARWISLLLKMRDDLNRERSLHGYGPSILLKVSL